MMKISISGGMALAGVAFLVGTGLLERAPGWSDVAPLIEAARRAALPSAVAQARAVEPSLRQRQAGLAVVPLPQRKPAVPHSELRVARLILTKPPTIKAAPRPNGPSADDRTGMGQDERTGHRKRAPITTAKQTTGQAKTGNGTYVGPYAPVTIRPIGSIDTDNALDGGGPRNAIVGSKASNPAGADTTTTRAKLPPAQPRVIRVADTGQRGSQRPVHGAPALSSILPADTDARRDLIRRLQRALGRAGCYTGPMDGRWSRQTQAAMGWFVRRVNARLPYSEPDFVLLALVQSHAAGTCTRAAPGAIAEGLHAPPTYRHPDASKTGASRVGTVANARPLKAPQITGSLARNQATGTIAKPLSFGLPIALPVRRPPPSAAGLREQPKSASKQTAAERTRIETRTASLQRQPRPRRAAAPERLRQAAPPALLWKNRRGAANTASQDKTATVSAKPKSAQPKPEADGKQSGSQLSASVEQRRAPSRSKLTQPRAKTPPVPAPRPQDRPQSVRAPKQIASLDTTEPKRRQTPTGTRTQQRVAKIAPVSPPQRRSQPTGGDRAARDGVAIPAPKTSADTTRGQASRRNALAQPQKAPRLLTPPRAATPRRPISRQQAVDQRTVERRAREAVERRLQARRQLLLRTRRLARQRALAAQRRRQAARARRQAERRRTAARRRTRARVARFRQRRPRFTADRFFRDFTGF